MTIPIPPSEWVDELNAFTARNASRRTRIEIDIPDFGAQEFEHDHELRGVSYDPRSREVEIMLGGLRGTEGHVTHRIADVREIELLARDGRDRVLRVGHAGGQTLVRLD